MSSSIHLGCTGLIGGGCGASSISALLICTTEREVRTDIACCFAPEEDSKSRASVLTAFVRCRRRTDASTKTCLLGTDSAYEDLSNS